MDADDAIKQEIRLWTLEMLVVNLLTSTILATGQPAKLMKDVRTQLTESARQRTFPSFDPAMSDYLSGELEAAFDRLLAIAEAQLPQLLKAS